MVQIHCSQIAHVTAIELDQTSLCNAVSCGCRESRELQKASAEDGSSPDLSTRSHTSEDRRIHSGGNCNFAWEDFRHISCSPLSKEVCEVNSHTDAAPPWMELGEEKSGGLHMGNLPSEFRKPKKLNPNRVGAAWAEKRKAQLEREKNGEIIVRDADADADWLPNFGRVWQAGTRKETRKEFETEKRRLLKINNQSNQSLKIQPYISKRMRVGSAEVGSVNFDA